MLPQQLGEIKQSNFNASSNMGYSFAEGDYRKDDTTNLKLMVYDCAGEAGSGMYALNYWTKMNVQQESSTGYTKIIDFMGGKAVESFDKNNNESKFTYVANDRLLVVLTGHNISAATLKEAAQKLNMKAS